jgi:putative Holliday junction resolvase
VARPALGIDYGSVRVGLALSENGTPRRLVTLTNAADLFEQLLGVIGQERVATVVVGLPRGEDGVETAQSQQVRSFAAALQQKVRIPVELQDEFDTSNLARQRLKAESKEVASQPALVDQEAAVIILEDYERST